jgi:hypothetical protein
MWLPIAVGVAFWIGLLVAHYRRHARGGTS